jgi:hypothetical protein
MEDEGQQEHARGGVGAADQVGGGEEGARLATAVSVQLWWPREANSTSQGRIARSELGGEGASSTSYLVGWWRAAADNEQSLVVSVAAVLHANVRVCYLIHLLFNSRIYFLK